MFGDPEPDIVVPEVCIVVEPARGARVLIVVGRTRPRASNEILPQPYLLHTIGA